MPLSNGQASTTVIFERFLDTNGDGTGSNDAAQDFSLTPGVFFIQPPVGSIFGITLINVHYDDTGTFNGPDYGAAPAVANGVVVEIEKNGVVSSITDQIPVKKNSDWQHIATNTQYTDWPGTGGSFLAQWLLLAGVGSPILLNGDTNDLIRLTLTDDFSFLNEQHFVAFGFN